MEERDETTGLGATAQGDGDPAPTSGETTEPPTSGNDPGDESDSER